MEGSVVQFNENGYGNVYHDNSDSEVDVNDRPPNFRDSDGNLFLVRCFACGGERGRENWAVVVALGVCAWCPWKDKS